MKSASDALPDLEQLGVDELRTLLRQLHADLLSHKAEIEALKLQILKLRRLQFGQRSEKRARQIEQLELWVEELEAADAQFTGTLAETAPAPTAPRTRGESSVRICHAKHRSLFRPSRHVPNAAVRSSTSSDDVSETLELQPVRFKVIRHVRPKLACATCDTIVQAPAPTRPIERGMAGPGCWPMCSLANTAITFRSIVRRRYTRVKGLISIARCWRNGLA